MTRTLVVLLMALGALAPPAAAGVGRPVRLPVGSSDYIAGSAIAVNDRGDRVVAYAPGNKLAIAYSRHGSARFGKPHVLKPGKGRDVEDLHVAIAASGAALVTWRESDESEYDPTEYRGDVVCCARTMAVVVRPGGRLHDRVAISPSSGKIESPDPAVLSIRDEKHFGVAVATHHFRTQGLPYEDRYAIYERFADPKRGWGPVQRIDKGHASRPLALTVSRSGSRLFFARTVSYAYDEALFEQVRDAHGKATASHELGVDLIGYQDAFAADRHGGFVLADLTGPYDHPSVRVVWSGRNGTVHERSAPGSVPYPQSVVVAFAAGGAGIVAWQNGKDVNVADVRDGDLGDFRTVAHRPGYTYDNDVAIASSGQWALTDRGDQGIHVLLGGRGTTAARSVTLPGTIGAGGSRSGIDSHGVASVPYSFGGYPKAALWVRRVR